MGKKSSAQYLTNSNRAPRLIYSSSPRHRAARVWPAALRTMLAQSPCCCGYGHNPELGAAPHRMRRWPLDIQSRHFRELRESRNRRLPLQTRVLCQSHCESSHQVVNAVPSFNAVFRISDEGKFSEVIEALSRKAQP